MTRITETLDTEQGNNPTPRYAECPDCKQKLFDVRELKGFATLRIKCRRCRKYVNVEIIGVE